MPINYRRLVPDDFLSSNPIERTVRSQSAAAIRGQSTNPISPGCHGTPTVSTSSTSRGMNPDASNHVGAFHINFGQYKAWILGW